VLALYQSLARRLNLDITYVLLRHPNAIKSDASAQAGISTDTSIDYKVLGFDSLQANHIEQFSISEQTLQAIENGSSIAVSASSNNQLIGLSFFATGSVQPAQNRGGNVFKGIGLHLPDTVCYQYKVWVEPAFRGKQVSAKMIDCALNHFSQSTIDTIVTTTDIANRAFYKSVKKRGFTKVGYAAECALFGKSFYWIPKPIFLSQTNDAQNITLFKGD